MFSRAALSSEVIEKPRNFLIVHLRSAVISEHAGACNRLKKIRDDHFGRLQTDQRRNVRSKPVEEALGENRHER